MAPDLDESDGRRGEAGERFDRLFHLGSGGYHQRKKAEEETDRIEARLRESEADLQLAQEAADLGRWSWDLRSQELAWTDRCRTLFGFL